MPQMHLKQPKFAYSDCEPLTKYKERIEKCKKNRIFKISLPIYLSIYLSMYLSIYLSIYLEEINFKKNYEMVKFFYNSKTISRPPFLSVTPKNINKEQKLSDIFRGFRKTSMDLKWVKLHFNHHLYRWYCCYFLSPSN